MMKILIPEPKKTKQVGLYFGQCLASLLYSKKVTLIFLQQIMKCCGSGMFIPDPGSEFFHPGSRVKNSRSRIRMEKYQYF
jgi:hypothetical protein